MLHIKFQGHRRFGSGEDLFKICTIYGHGGHLGLVTWTIWTNFRSPMPQRLHKKFDFDWPSCFIHSIASPGIFGHKFYRNISQPNSFKLYSYFLQCQTKKGFLYQIRQFLRIKLSARSRVLHTAVYPNVNRNWSEMYGCVPKWKC